MPHTPGPWDIRHDSGVSRVYRKTKIADVYSEAFQDIVTQHANARLVSAAPELLEALLACSMILGLPSEDDHEGRIKAARKLTATALLKTYGPSNNTLT